MAASARRGAVLLLVGVKNFPRTKCSSQITIPSLMRLSSLVNYQLPKALSTLRPGFKEEDPNMKEAGDFSKFRISKEATKQLQAKGINYLFPIQSQTFDYIYDGHDLIGQARTGTGKTLSFALPLVEKLKLEIPSSKRGRAPKVLVLAPTRELAKQVSSEFENLNSELAIHCMYGGVSYGPQVMAIKAGLDVVVGTPGRILDHMVNGTLDLSQLRHVVIDEVDRMLDMGFAQSVEDIIAESYSGAGNEKPQTLLFSATLPPWVVRTAKKYMSDDRKIVDLIGDQHLKASETVQHLAIKCPYEARSSAINDVIQVYCGSHSRALIFTETKNDANTLALNSVLKQEAQVLHGDIPQEQREITLKSFRDGKLRCLVATDVAARGLDIPEVDLVVQCEPPKDLDTYIHRSGRTGRAGREGISIIFYKQSQEQQLHAVAKRAGVAFKFVKAPKAADVLKSSAEDATRFIEAVSPEVLDKFREAAESLVDKYGAVDAVAAALAHISGITDIKPRSLISGLEGFSTYLMKASVELHGPGYIWRALENNVPEIKEKVQLMKFCQDRMSVVFDVPDEFVEELEEVWGGGRGGITLEKIDELPDLIEKPRYGQVSRQSFRGGRYGARAGGYGGKESFRKDFRSVRNNMRSYEEPSFRGRQPSHAQRFNDWMNESHSSVG